jgi:MFS family permease
MSTLTIKQNDKADPVRIGSAYLAILFVSCFVSSALGGTVSTLMSVYLPVVVQELLGSGSGNELNYISGYINALFIFGWALGGFSWGVVSDRIGRKKSLVLAIAMYGLFTILTGTMNTWWGIVVCRFLSGFGVGGVLVIGFTLMSEVWPHRSRPVFIGILSISFPVGIFSAGLINYIVSDWRQAFWVGVIPVAISFVCLWLLKESTVWQTSQRQKTKAYSSVGLLFSKLYRRQLVTGSLIFGTMLIGLWAIFSWLPTWVQTLVTTDAQKQRGLSMMFLGIGGLSGGFFSGWLVKLLGQRRSMILCFSVCTLLSFVLFKTNTQFSNIIFPEILVLAIFFGASQGVLSSYIPQLFPVSLRATATGFCFNIGRLVTGTAVLFIAVLETAFGGYGNAIFTFSLTFVVGLLVVLFTKKEITN